MEDSGRLINSRDSQREWLKSLSGTLAQQQAANAPKRGLPKIAKNAEFLCLNCNLIFTKTAAIDLHQGVCPECREQIMHKDELKELEEKKASRTFECVKCGSTFPRFCVKSAGFKCECGGSRFINQELLDQVCANTVAYLSQKGINVDQIGHERGIIHAQLSGVADGVKWASSVKTAGKFTRNDILIYKWNAQGGTATVATAQDDPIIKLARNDAVKIKWDVEDDNYDPHEIVLQDASGNNVGLDSNLVWYAKSGPVKGRVVKASQNGELVVGITESPEFGRAKKDTYFDQIVLTQEHLLSWNIEAE